MLELLLLEGSYIAKGGFLKVEAVLLARLAYLFDVNSEGVSIGHEKIVFLEYFKIFCEVFAKLIFSTAFS